MTSLAAGRDHAGADRRALAAVRHRQQLELARRRLGPGADEVGGAVGAAVVDDEDLDRLRELARARVVPRGRGPAPMQVAEQLVEGRAEPLLLVVGGQDDGQGAGGHAGQSRARRMRLVTGTGGPFGGRPSVPLPARTTLAYWPRMIRRHAFWFRALLIAVDGLVAVGLLVGAVRVAIRPRLGDVVAPDRPRAARRSSLLYAATWVADPDAQRPVPAAGAMVDPQRGGRGRPRDRRRWRWSRSSVLFLFHLPRRQPARSCSSCSRPRPLVTIVVRAVLRLVLERYRRQGSNLRFVLVLGAGPRARRSRPSSRATASSASASSASSTPTRRSRRATAGRCWARSTTSRPSSTRRSSTRSRSACRSRMWDRIDAIAGLCEEEGKIVRIPMDVMDRAISAGRVEELDGTPVFSLVSGPDRALALAAKRALDLLGAAVGLVLLSPILLGDRVAIAARRRPARSCSARPGSASTGARSRSSSSARWSSTPRRSAPGSAIATRSTARCSRSTPTRGSPGSGASCGARRSTSCRSCGTCSAAR